MATPNTRFQKSFFGTCTQLRHETIAQTDQTAIALRIWRHLRTPIGNQTYEPIIRNISAVLIGRFDIKIIVTL